MNNFNDENFIISIKSDEFEQYFTSFDNDKIFYVELDGKEIVDKFSLYSVFGKIIGFPDYFGNNWDAFWDVMRDEYFITKDLIICMKNINNLFTSSHKDKSIFLETLFDLINSNPIDTKIQIFIIK